MTRAEWAALVAAGIAGAGVLAWFSDRAPYPYAQRRVLDVPLPLLSPARLATVLAPRTGQRVLEIGPGTGLQSTYIAPLLCPGGRLDIVDVQPEMLKHVTRRAHAGGIDNIVAHLADATALPFPEHTFDAAYLVTALGEINGRTEALRELRRVLKPRARLVVGEFADRHHVTLTTLVRDANCAGLHFTARVGIPFAYYATFQPCPALPPVRTPIGRHVGLSQPGTRVPGRDGRLR